MTGGPDALTTTGRLRNIGYRESPLTQRRHPCRRAGSPARAHGIHGVVFTTPRSQVSICPGSRLR